MLTLCLDTSGRYLNIALCNDGIVAGGVSRVVGAGHSEILSDELMGFLEKRNTFLSDIRMLAVTVGPGSFTGLRVGMAFTKGLAAGLNLMVVPLNTLDAMAWSQTTASGYVSPMLDAKKKEIYTALYHIKDGEAERSGEYFSIAPQKWIETLPANTIVYGSGEAAYSGMLSDDIKQLRLDGEFLDSGKMLCGMAKLADRLFKLDRAIKAEDLDACYIRPADAILKRQP